MGALMALPWPYFHLRQLGILHLLLLLLLTPSSCYHLQVLARRPTSLSLKFPHPEAGLLHYSPTREEVSNTWETGVVLPGTTIFTLAGLQPNTSYLLRWKPATGLRFSDVTINTTEIHNHEVAREIHSPEHDLEVKDKYT